MRHALPVVMAVVGTARAGVMRVIVLPDPHAKIARHRCESLQRDEQRHAERDEKAGEPDGHGGRLYQRV